MPALTLYPAIDLKDGACVRLRRGAMDQATVFSEDPAAQARAFQDAGCRWLHVVDLNGAFAGRSVNAAAVRAILAAVDVPVQLGGGLRDLAAVAHWLEAGVRRVILGSAAVKNPALVREACRAYPGRVAVGIDAREGRVAVEGWAETSSLGAVELGLAVQDAGAAAIIFTDIGRDGMLGGLNVAATADLARQITSPVIASGGIAGVEDLRALAAAARAVAPGIIEGVVVGRALYDGRLDIATALGALAAESAGANGGLSPDSDPNAEEDLFEVASLFPRTTGLPMTVWVSPRGTAKHDVRIKANVTRGDQINVANAAVIGIHPTPYVIAGQLAPDDEAQVFEWVRLNTAALVAYWEGRIDTVQLCRLLQPVS